MARDIGIRTIYPLIGDHIGDIDEIQRLFAAGLHARQGISVQALSSSGTVSVPNSSSLRFALQVRTIWYEAAIKEMLRVASDPRRAGRLMFFRELGPVATAEPPIKGGLRDRDE